ncbi:unnamed protein product, partial [Discosporangium mesarthrocarpum]
RSLGQPVRLFGENVADIRERLRRYLAQEEIELEEQEKVQGMVAPKPVLVPRGVQVRGDSKAAEAQGAKKADVVYSSGSDGLLEARALMASFSFSRARERLAGAKRRRERPEEVKEMDSCAAEVMSTARHMVINSSQIGDDRPLSAIKVSPEGGMVATGSWTCLVKLWDIQSLEMQKLLRGHSERITAVSWHPDAYSSVKNLLATGLCPPRLPSSRTAKLWDCDTGECVQTFHGHMARLAKIDFHPCGLYLGTASFDTTWRLWDVEKGKEILLQDGHHKEVYGIAFQRDGALVVTGDLNGDARTWDLRSGKCLWTMEGHVKQITCTDFSPCGYEIATGSDDHMVRVWDIRKRQCIYCLPAHSALVSDVRYVQQGSGEVIMSASFDGTAKLWSTRDWSLLRTLSGHEGRV